LRYVWGILLLGLTVLFHEYGHMLAARKNGVVVEEFSVGFGPRILSHKSKKSGTVYSWKAIPFGGSCAMMNEEEGEPVPGSFVGAKLWQRALIVAAGPLFNFLMALMAAVVLVAFSGADQPIVTEVETGSAAEEAGLEAGDEIVSYDGRSILNSRDLYINEIIYGDPVDETEITVIRDGEKVRITYQPETVTRWMLGFYYSDTDDNSGVQITQLEKDSALKDAGLESGDVITALNGVELSNSEDLQNYLEENPLDGSAVDVTYRRGSRTYTAEDVVPKEVVQGVRNFSYNMGYERQGFFGVIKYSFVEVAYNVRLVWKTLGGLVTGIFSINDFTGPIGIVKTVGDTYQQAVEEVSFGAGLLTLMSILVMISANLGVMNLIPLPALDGGRLLLFLIEAIRKKPVSQKVQYYIDSIGLAALLMFSAYVTIHDILRII
jgi:regulator of sigma E protease